ncbi:glycosyltransferase family 4 protein [Thauera sp.]|jgi:Fuc2NAc and GlcNAc transferase|uniref:MraY family glycosyltransferase n=1 Tax=Thauera sp. TaxID=1905334 RepID=UPI002A371CA0|nr:glycosyltransferase family 4 protein [Thauera sp.]MDX9885994.1 glycosyltransferase family 4 protein [Thauera sp.]
MNSWFLIFLVSAASWGLTYGLRKYALSRSLMDIPNARSSHSVPTPRGGGVAIVVSFLVALALIAATGGLDSSACLALLGAGGIVALVGFLDDHGHIAARWRLLAHFVAAFWALGWLGGAPALQLFGVQFDLGWPGFALVAVYLVWLLNLYNFMDGIDGIASVEAICVCVGGALLYMLLGKPDLALLPLMLAAAVAGFLYWNFPPARIFMGDAGSGFLGIVLGIMSIQAGWVDPALFWSWVILLGVFVVDATFTLMRRLLRGDKVYEAHRSHAYQYASRQFGRHLPVTLTVGVINLAWLLPIALLVGTGRVDGVIGAVLAYAPLVLLAIKLRAGELEVGPAA